MEGRLNDLDFDITDVKKDALLAPTELPDNAIQTIDRGTVFAPDPAKFRPGIRPHFAPGRRLTIQGRVMQTDRHAVLVHLNVDLDTPESTFQRFPNGSDRVLLQATAPTDPERFGPGIKHSPVPKPSAPDEEKDQEKPSSHPAAAASGPPSV